MLKPELSYKKAWLPHLMSSQENTQEAIISWNEIMYQFETNSIKQVKGLYFSVFKGIPTCYHSSSVI